MMSYFIKKLLAGFLLSFCMIAYAEKVSWLDSSFADASRSCRASVRHIERGGIGYNQGYTTLEAFFAPHLDLLSPMPFLDVRGHIFDDGKFSANVGLGLRKLAGNRVYGFNTYYDYRNTKKIHYNQMGLGCESLGERWDFRLNGYLPVGKKITSPYQKHLIGFSGHHLLLSQKYQFAMRGFNAELGCHFGRSRSCEFYVAGGPYYFAGTVGRKIWGGKVRLVGKFTQYLTLELSNSYDKMFHDRFQGQITLSVPFGAESPARSTNACHTCDVPSVLFSRMIQPVERQEINIVGCNKQKTAVLDPATGNPFYFVFVDNTSHSQGTYESPYPTLALAQENSKVGDIIYVFPGDGTTQGMDAGITLQRNQKFWGAGTDHSLKTMQGNFTIPAQSDSMPKMTNAVGDGITLDAVNQVSGFIITDVAGNGISGAYAENIEISDCTIDNSELDQIHLEYRDSSGVATLNNLVISNGSLNGLFIDATASSMECTVSNCAIQGNGVFSLDTSFAHQANLSLVNNIIERNGTCSNITFAGPATAVVSGNTFKNNNSVSSAPLIISAAENPVAVTIENNIISESVCGAVQMVVNDTSAAQLTISRNIITNNGTGSLGSLGSAVFINPNGTTSANCIIDLTDNIFTGNSASTLYCSNGDFNNFEVNAAGNTISDNNGGGMVFANGCTAFTLNAKNNIISNGGDHGIATGGINLTTAHMTISNNQITGNTNSASAIALSHAGTDLNFVAADNNLSDNSSSGIVMYSSNAIENMTVKIENNTITNNQNLGSNAAGGIDIEQFINLSGTLTNNKLSNNAGSGVYIGSTEPSPYACVTMSGNNSDTDYVLSNDTGIFNLAPCDADTVNVGTITSIGIITSVQLCPEAGVCPS